MLDIDAKNNLNSLFSMFNRDSGVPNLEEMKQIMILIPTQQDCLEIAPPIELAKLDVAIRAAKGVNGVKETKAAMKRCVIVFAKSENDDRDFKLFEFLLEQSGDVMLLVLLSEAIQFSISCNPKELNRLGRMVLKIDNLFGAKLQTLLLSTIQYSIITRLSNRIFEVNKNPKCRSLFQNVLKLKGPEVDLLYLLEELMNSEMELFYAIAINALHLFSDQLTGNWRFILMYLSMIDPEEVWK